MLANIFGDWYWPVLAIIVLFGGSQLPKLAKNAGLAAKEFRKAHAEATAPLEPPAGAYPAPLAPGTTVVVPAPGPNAVMAAPPAAALYSGVAQPQNAMSAQPGPSQLAQAQPGPMTQPTADERITLTRTELDALLADREARAKSPKTGEHGTQDQI